MKKIPFFRVVRMNTHNAVMMVSYTTHHIMVVLINHKLPMKNCKWGGARGGIVAQQAKPASRECQVKAQLLTQLLHYFLLTSLENQWKMTQVLGPLEFQIPRPRTSI